MRARLLLSMFGCVATTLAIAGSASAVSNKPLVVILCKFTDQTNEPQTVQYYQDMFSETGAGKRGVFDFWRDVSYGNLDLTGTIVKGWYTAQKKVAEWDVLPRDQQLDTCASEADADVDFSDFSGVVVLTNHANDAGPLFGI